MTAKRRAQQALRRVPDDATADALLAELYFRLKVEGRLSEARAGRTITHTEAKRRLRRWLSR